LFFGTAKQSGKTLSGCGGEKPEELLAKRHGGKVTMKDLDLLRREVWAW